MYVSALTSRTIEQAAELGDGIMPTFWTPERVERSAVWTARGRAKAPESGVLDFTLGMPTYLGEDLAEMRDAARANLEMYTPAFRS